MGGVYFNSGIDRGFEDDLRNMNSQMNSFSQNVQGEGKKIDSVFKTMASGMAAYFTFGAVQGFTQKLISVRSEFEMLGVAFETMLGSKEKADTLVAEITALAAKTPFSLTEVAQGAKQLLAFGESSETVIDTVRRMGDIASGTGTDIGGLNLAYGQVMTKGKLMTQEMYQFAERGVPIIQELAKVMNVSKEEVGKLVESGQVGFPIVQQALKNLTSEGGMFFNLMEKQSGTLGGMISNMGDAFDRMLNQIGEMNSSSMKNIISGATALIENWETVIDVIKVLVATYGVYKAALIATIAWEKAKAASAVQAALAGRALTTWEILHTTILYKLNAAQKAVNTTMKANPYGLALAAIVAIIGAIAIFGKKSKDLTLTQEAMARVSGKTADEFGKQKVEIDNLVASARNQELTDKQRVESIEKLKEIIPGYNAELSAEGKLINENTAAIEAYLKQLELKIKMTAVQDEMAELWRKEREQIQLLEKAQDDYNRVVKESQQGVVYGGDKGISGQIARNKYVDVLKGRVDVADTALQNIRTAIQDLKTEYTSAEKSLADFFQSHSGESSEKAIRTIKDLEDELKVLEKQRKEATDIGDEAELARLAKLIIQKRKEIDAFKIKEGDKGKDTSVDRLERQHQERINLLTDQYGREQSMEKVFQQKMLENELIYLKAKRKLMTSELEKLKIDETIIKTEISLDKISTDNEFQKLLDQYKTYSEKRKGIEEKGIKESNELIVQGFHEKAGLAQVEMEKELKALEAQLLSMNEDYQNWYQEKLPGIVKRGMTELSKELKRLQDELSWNIEGMSPELIAEYQGKITALQNSINNFEKTNTVTNLSFKDSIQLLKDVNDLAGELADTFAGANEQTRIIAEGITGTISGLLGMANAMYAVSTAATVLEKANAILLAISMTVKVVSSIVNMFEKSQKLKIENYVKELQMVHSINMALIEQIKLYQEGNEYFSDDRWGAAIRGLNAYNSALVSQQRVLEDIYVNSGAAILRRLGVGEDARSTIQQYAGDYANQLQMALSSINVRTRDRSGFANFFGMSDEYQGLLNAYPQLIDANGRLNQELLETIINTADLSEADKERLKQLLELSQTAETAIGQFGEYISSIFGGVGDEIAQAFQTMYETGDDAMTSLERSFSDMIESFTRDAIEFAFLQPYLAELNSMTQLLGERYARGEITVEQLQSDILGLLGDFYSSLNSLQPHILEAFRQADNLASQLGFDSAFNDDDETRTNSRAGQIQQAITEQTGSELVGRLGAIMLSNERIANHTQEIYTLAIQNLVVLNRIRENTDYLPEIAEHTRRTVERLTNV